MKRLTVASVLALAMLLVLFGVAYAITNGQPDDDGHPYVGLVFWPAGGGYYWICSGSAISPNVFVTAAHCFDGWDGEQVLVNFEPDAWIANPFDDAYEGTPHPHPDWCIGCATGLPGFDTYDVAVVVFDQSVELAEYANLPTEGLVDALPMNTPVMLVGYGVQWDTGGGPPIPEGVGTRFYASTELIASNHKHSDEYIKLRANPSKGSGGVCFGDSGGPDLLEGEGVGNDIIIAVNSYVTNGSCAGITYSNRIDLEYALEFINSFP